MLIKISMKKTFSFLLICLFSFTLFAQQQQTHPTAKYVILISVDGLRPDFYLDASWPTPNMQSLKSKGAYAQGVRGIFPTVTYPSHTTIITGAYPARHGIYDNEMFSNDTGATKVWYRQAKYIKVPTLWDAVKKAGLTSACISWPVSVGAPVDYNFPEDWVDDNQGTQKINAGVKPAGLYEEIEQKVTGKLKYENMNMRYLTIDENLSRIAAYLIKTYKPNFTTLHIVCVDHAEHTYGRAGEGVQKAIASADHAISNILEAVDAAGIKDSTAIIITGDHGFVDTHSAIYPNVWLSRNGLIKKVNGKTEWKAWFAGGDGSGSAFLHLKDKSDIKTLEKVKSILNNLPAPTQRLFRVVEKPELEKVGANPDAVLAIAAAQGIMVRSALEGDDIRPAKGGTHGYFPDFHEIQTGFIANGAGITPGVVIPVMGLEDIAPVIAQLLGLDFTAPDGMLLPGIINIKQ